jgi:Sugar kinases, ribokinase family
MADARYDILGLGNAIVDIIAQVPDAFLAEHGLVKSSMALIQETQAETLLAAMGDTTTVSGGSAANTIIGAAGFGCSGCFIGRVRDDALGDLFEGNIRESGIDFPVAHAATGPSTARCFILVTPDGHRTMNTYLGACQDLAESDVDRDTVAASQIIYLEGYLWDPPAAKAAFLKAARIAHEAGRRVALSLSDSFCVGRYRAEFLTLIDEGHVDILFANEAELTSLYEESDFERAVAQLRAKGLLAAVTRSEKGCIVVAPDNVVAVPAAPISQLVDTTGAGDLFAAGFIAGLVRGHDHVTCARLGSLAAAEIIQHIGARPQTDLKALAARNGIAL